jgi:hypothetical protein
MRALRSSFAAAAVAVSFGLCVSAVDAAPIARLTLTSEPGDFVGQGDVFDITYSPATSDFFVAAILPFAPEPSFVEFTLGTVTGGPDETFATLAFSTTQLGVLLAPGLYTDAERALFASPGHPGLDITFQGRGCGVVSGRFSIDDATFSADGLTINSFGASFEQRCDGADATLSGTFEYQIDPIPEPSTAILVVSGLVLCARRLRRHH